MTLKGALVTNALCKLEHTSRCTRYLSAWPAAQGVRNPQVGKNLRLHPVVPVVGLFPGRNVSVWKGAPMTTVCTELASGRDKDFYGCRIECPSAHPGIITACLQYFGARQFKRQMLHGPDTGFFIVLCRDRDAGEVRVCVCTCIEKFTKKSSSHKKFIKKFSIHHFWYKFSNI